jgi:hypothetical protein
MPLVVVVAGPPVGGSKPAHAAAAEASTCATTLAEAGTKSEKGRGGV